MSYISNVLQLHQHTRYSAATLSPFAGSLCENTRVDGPKALQEVDSRTLAPSTRFWKGPSHTGRRRIDLRERCTRHHSLSAPFAQIGATTTLWLGYPTIRRSCADSEDASAGVCRSATSGARALRRAAWRRGCSSFAMRAGCTLGRGSQMYHQPEPPAKLGPSQRSRTQSQLSVKRAMNDETNYSAGPK